MVVVLVQLEAVVTVAAAAVAAVVASWPLVEDRMYLLPAWAARTSTDRNSVFVTGRKRAINLSRIRSSDSSDCRVVTH